MSLIEPTSFWFIESDTLKETSKTDHTDFQVVQPSDIKSSSCQNSDIKIQSLNDSRKSNFQDLSVYEFLDKCDEFITQHSTTKQTKKVSVNLLDNSFHSQIPKTCSECKHHFERELEWMKQKIRLEEKIAQLEEKIQQNIWATELWKQDQLKQYLSEQKNSVKYALKIQPQVFSLEIKQCEDYGIRSQFPSIQSISGLPIHSKNQIISEKELLLESIKNVNDKLVESETQNKYLKIQNRSLLKTKTQIETMKKQIEKTKSQRDIFKKKLISIAQKQIQSKDKFDNLSNEKSSTAGLKERGLGAKKKNETLFELSLTDASSMREPQRQNQQNKGMKKQQRLNFTTLLKPT